MNDFSTSDILAFINLCVSLTDLEKNDLKIRVFDELEARGNRLSPELAEELALVFEQEEVFIASTLLPEQDATEQDAEDAYTSELDRIRPQLDRLVEEYHQETEELKAEYDKAFRQIDLEMDTLLKASASVSDAAEIEAIKSKLSQPSSSNS